MRVYLIQHGEAVPKEKNPQRPLSETGKIATEKMAKFLKDGKVIIDTIWHSKKARAIQTAEIISKSLTNAKAKLIGRDDINPLDSVDKLSLEISKLNKNLAIVGHLPFLQKLASLLLTGSQDSEIITFNHSGVVCLEYINNWKIVWLVNPDLILP